MAWPVSDAYLAQIAESHQATGLAQVCHPSGDVLEEIPVKMGTVEADAGRSILRSTQLTLLDDTGRFIPRAPGDLLHPWSGNEIRLYRSVVLDDGTLETVPQGVYRFGAPKVDLTAEGAQISLDGYDRASRVAANAWTYMVTTYAKTVPQAIRDALVDRFPALPVSVAASTQQAPFLWWGPGIGDDPWHNIRDLVTAANWQLVIDRNGVATATPATPDRGAVREWVEGAYCTVTDVQVELPAADGPNGVVAMGGDIRNNFRIESWVEDSSHPLWRGGPYGEVAEVIAEHFADQAAAQAAVDARMTQILTGVTGISVEMVPDAALDPLDVVRASLPSIGVDGLFRVRRVVCPAGAQGSMSVDLEVI